MLLGKSKNTHGGSEVGVEVKHTIFIHKNTVSLVTLCTHFDTTPARAGTERAHRLTARKRLTSSGDSVADSRLPFPGKNRERNGLLGR